jgi:hypothetical protein
LRKIVSSEEASSALLGQRLRHHDMPPVGLGVRRLQGRMRPGRPVRDCGSADVPWLSEETTSFTIPPGGHVTVTVSLDDNDPSVTAPGTYSAELLVGTDTPYAVPAVPVKMVVNAP